MTTLAPSFLVRSSLFLQVTGLGWFQISARYHHQLMSYLPLRASEKLIYNFVNTLAPTFSIGSFFFLQVTRKTIKIDILYFLLLAST